MGSLNCLKKYVRGQIFEQKHGCSCVEWDGFCGLGNHIYF